jgi:hypothetical protein
LWTSGPGEQKNDAVVRKYIGYDRLERDAVREHLAEACRPLVPLLNFFIPTMKLESKVKISSEEFKKYDAPRSPCRRLLESEGLPPDVKVEPTRLCGLYNQSGLVTTQYQQGRPRITGGVATQSFSSGRELTA